MNDYPHREFNIRQLAAMTGLSVRTIRYYVAEGLAPPPDGRGRSATYGETHLLRLQLVRRLVEQRVPLTEIKQRLAGLSTNEVRNLLERAEARKERLERTAGAGSPQEYVAALLEEDGLISESPPRYYAMPMQEPSGMARSSERRRAWSEQRQSSEEVSGHAVPPPSRPSAQRWQRFVLAPGVELNISDEAQADQAELITRLLRAAQGE